MARFIQSFYIFAIDNLFLSIIRPKLEMDMRDIFSANAADFSVPMRNSLLFPACRAYAMPVAKPPFEVFRKASISAAKQLRLSNKGNKITTGGGYAKALYRPFSPQGLPKDFCFRQLPLSRKIHFFAYRISAMRQRAGGDFHISPEPCHACQCCTRRFPGLFVPLWQPDKPDMRI